MPTLASPSRELKSHYDVVIVGSGYGGAVAACRFARVTRPTHGDRQRSLDVCVLERGREFQPGDFPRSLREGLREMRVQFPTFGSGRKNGLYDFRISTDVSVLVGCGVGGTSLINANVLERPRPAHFDVGWPDQLPGGGELEAGYARAMQMLGAAAYPDKWPRINKLVALERQPSRKSFGLPPLAVSTRAGPNAMGVPQQPCILCGDCVSGCNHHAKNHVGMNYLADAVSHGAQIFSEMKVLRVEARAAGGWLVWFKPAAADSQGVSHAQMFLHAERVILAAGTLGSTEILLRSRKHGLPTSPWVGHGFNGNGDSIEFGYNVDRPVNAIGLGYRTPDEQTPIGPTITGQLDLRYRNSRILIQEASIPGALAATVRWVLPLFARLAGNDTDRGDHARELGREFLSFLRGARSGALKNTQTYLVISETDGHGRIELARSESKSSRQCEGVRITKWQPPRDSKIQKKTRAMLRALTKRLGGTHVINPFSTRLFGKRLITVHPLGGCAMGDPPRNGATWDTLSSPVVVNDLGQVFTGQGGAVHSTLHVSDGSVVPRPLGANPLWTISALTERMCFKLLNDAKRPADWNVENCFENDFRSAPRTRARRIGIRYTETLKGSLRYRNAQQPIPVQLTLFVEVADLTEFLKEPQPPASVIGSARIGNESWTVTQGEFTLFTKDPERVDMRIMAYRLKLTSTAGQSFELQGSKELGLDTTLGNVWKRLTRLPFTLRSNGVVEAQGELRMNVAQVCRMVLGATITNADHRRESWAARGQLARYFGTVVFRAVAWPFRRAEAVDPYQRRAIQNKRPPRRGDGTIVHPENGHRFFTPDRADVRLTCYRGGQKGPVILAPGFGNSTIAFELTTIRQNFVEALVLSGYEVWLLDYRGSHRSEASRQRFTVDDIVKYDFPMAIDYVLESTRVRDPSDPTKPITTVQFLGHCVGSLALMLTLLSDEKAHKKVRTAICSQFMIRLEMPWQNRVKAGLRLGEVLELVQFGPTLTADFDRYMPARFWFVDRLLHFYPTRERCRSPVCRRTLFLYGENYRHDLLNQETHDAIYDIFDRTNLTTLKHLSKMIRRREAVRWDNGKSYLDTSNAKARLNLPIILLQGMSNGLFLPRGAEKTLQWLKANGTDPGLYRELPIPGYGHLDTFIGRDAHEGAYPKIITALEEGDKLWREKNGAVTVYQEAADPVPGDLQPAGREIR